MHLHKIDLLEIDGARREIVKVLLYVRSKYGQYVRTGTGRALESKFLWTLCCRTEEMMKSTNFYSASCAGDKRKITVLKGMNNSYLPPIFPLLCLLASWHFAALPPLSVPSKTGACSFFCFLTPSGVPGETASSLPILRLHPPRLWRFSRVRNSHPISGS